MGGDVEKVLDDGYVQIKGYTNCKFKPVLIVPIEKGVKFQKEIDKAEAKYRRKCKNAESELKAVIKSITK